MKFHTLALILFLLITSASHADSDGLTLEQKRAIRRTPVVKVFETCKDAVVNISSTQIVQVRSMRFDPFFDDFFDLPRHNL